MNDILRFRQKCYIITEEVCQPIQERKCEPVYEEQCQEVTNRICSTAYKDVPYQDTDCTDEYVKECPQVWEERYGAKIWVPETKNCLNLVGTIQNKDKNTECFYLCLMSFCKNFFQKRTNCKTVTKYKKEQYQKCEDLPHRVCDEVPAYENICQTLTRNNCYTDYKDVPYEDTECTNEYVRQCPEVWEERYGTKVWVPSTNNCVNLVRLVYSTPSNKRGSTPIYFGVKMGQNWLNSCIFIY